MMRVRVLALLAMAAASARDTSPVDCSKIAPRRGGGRQPPRRMNHRGAPLGRNQILRVSNEIAPHPARFASRPLPAPRREVTSQDTEDTEPEGSPALLGAGRGDRGTASESEPVPRKIQGFGAWRGLRSFFAVWLSSRHLGAPRSKIRALPTPVRALCALCPLWLIRLVRGPAARFALLGRDG
jgi:hypothetical protein